MKLSIITINLNNAVGLERTIQSVVSQTYKDYEYIVIDGNSQDGSVDIIRKYEKQITTWISEKDTGIYNAMNKGIQRATGEYILFLNAGDTLYDQFILTKVFSENNYTEDILYGDYLWVHNEHGEELMSFAGLPSRMNYKNFRTLPHSGGAFIKRVLFENYGGYDESLKIIGDKDHYMRLILQYGVSLRYLSLVLSRYDGYGLSAGGGVKLKNQLENSLVSLRYYKGYRYFIYLLKYWGLTKRIRLFEYIADVLIYRLKC